MAISDENAPHLVVTSPEELAGLALPLTAPEMVIGHSDTADLVLEDRFVSRRHALVTVDPSGLVTIRDLNSTGGTFVNGERLAGPRVLQPGDLVQFADLVARFEPGSSPVPAGAAANAATRLLDVLTDAKAPPGAGATPEADTPSAGTDISGPVVGPGGDGMEPLMAEPSAVESVAYTVTGTVRSPALPGVGGLTVELADKNIGGDQALASTQTGSDGSYAFRDLAISLAYLARHHKTQPDLQVRVSAGDGFLAASAVAYSAPATVSLDVVLPASAAGLPSEYETLTANLAAIYPGSLGNLQEGDGRSDITYLAGRTKWDARLVAMRAIADQLSEITAPAAGTSMSSADTGRTQVWPVPTVSLRPEFYYALFRAGLPANPDGLFRASPATVQAIWQQATTTGVIPQALAKEVPAATASFQAISAARSLSAAPPAGVSTLREMLQPTLPEAAQQEQFARLYAQHQGDWTSFWPAVEQTLGAGPASQLRLMGQLFYLTVNNQPLVAALTEAEAGRPLTSALDLATRGYYDPAKWAPLIGASIPAGIPGADAGEQAGNYARLLAAQVRAAYPTAVLADQVKRNVLPVAGTADTAAGVADFLNSHQGDFEIGAEQVEAFIARNGLTETPAGVVAEIKRLQRVYQLTPDDTSLAVLLRHNLDSAFAITRYDRTGFIRAFSDKLGGAHTAAAVHARAQQVFASVLNLAVTYLSGRVAPALGGQVPVRADSPPQPTPAADQVTAQATLEDLFGSLDYCNCRDCGSILSPAAYLVDLLNYIDQPAPAAGLANPQDALFQRRPDLQYLPLTCENTNTALPYIDIVNETLEYFVANGLSLAGYQGHDTGDAVTSAELIASPHYVNDGAYGILQDAFFPPPLPFNRPLELLRLQLGKLGVALPDAMAALREGDQLVNRKTPASFGWSDILIEQLAISRNEYRLFTDPALQLGDLYGLPDASALATLQTSSLASFSRRLGVSYDDLAAIIQTRFMNPNASLIPRLEQLNAPFGTLQVLHDTLSTPQSIATEFISALPAGLDATQYGGSSPTDYQAVVNWVTSPRIYPRIMDIITITSPAQSPGDCSGTGLQLRYSRPDNTQNLLTGTDFVKLIRFIRLWRKLAPLLGNAGNTVTITQTDAVLTALYPAAGIPADTSNAANDPANRVLLDNGCATLLQRTGFLFQVMNLLSVTAGDALTRLLACWAPIGTTGPAALYQSMFLTPTLLQHDPGAQTATVASPVSVGDVLHTSINGSQEITPYTVQAGDTAASAAAAIAAAINAATAPDPVSGLPLSSRFSAASDGGVVTVKAGFTLACSVSAGASETYTAGHPATPVSQSSAIAGPVTAGDTLTTTLDGVAIPYTAVAGDTPETIAAGIAAAINATTISDPFSGLPLNQIAAASSAAETVTVIAANTGAPFTLTCSLDPANAGTYSAGPPVPAAQTATITGAVQQGDTLVTTVNSVAVSYTAGPADTDATALAASIAATISTAVQPDPATQLPLSSEVQATSTGNVITITAVDPASPVTLACSVTTGTETYTAAGPFPGTATAAVTGALPAGVTLTTMIDALPLAYVTAPGDTPATIAAAIAAAINTTTTADLVTSLPLNTVVTAAAAGGVVTVTAASPTTPFTLAASVTTGGYTAGRQAPPFADDGYGNFLADPSQTLFGHEPTLCAACNLTGAEFALITTALGFGPSTPLTLANVSALFRFSWLAHTLGLSVLEFLLLREVTGLDPFAPLDPGTPGAEPPVIRLIRLLGASAAAGLDTVQALYLMWNQDISGTSAPRQADVTGLAFALAAGFAAVEAEFSLQDDPSGSIAEGLMTLVYGAAASDYFFGLLNSTVTTAVTYSSPPGQPALPPPVVAAAAGRLSYDDLRKQLSFAGVLDPATQSAIDTAAGSDPDLVTAIAGLAAASQQTAGPFFATYPELRPLYAAYIASGDPVQAKRTALLDSFLPILKRKRKQEQALASITSAAGTDPGFASALLQDPAILHADADVAAAAISDLVAVENHGLSAQFFLSNDPASPPDQEADAVPVLSYAQTATIGGAITIGNVLQTTINGVTIPYPVAAADTTLALLAGNVAAEINATTSPDPATTLPLNQVVSASARGNVIAISGTDPSGASSFISLACSVSAGATETYTSGSQLPPGPGAGQIAGAWSGYITAPQDGFYDINVAADPGAAITLHLADLEVAGAQAGSLWSNRRPISLVAGQLVPIIVSASSIKTTLKVSWRSLGQGWEVIPSQYLYPLTLVSRLGNTYLRFLKATSLAAALSLTPAEISYLGTWPGFSVNTTDSATIAAGPAVFTPASMANIAVGSALVIDHGSAQETVTVTATTPATFSAVAAHPHDGSASPFTITGQPLPRISQGWLNFLATQADPEPVTAASLAGVLTALLGFSRIKQALSPADERLLAVLRNPAATLRSSKSALLSLTGWAAESVNALLTQFFGSTDPAGLSSVENFRRVYDAYSIVRTCGLTASALISAITNAPSAATVSALQSALRAQYAESGWLTVIRPINDTARIRQRDALVAYILQQLGDSTAEIDTTDRLYEHLLIDTQTQPPVLTSRIRLALSAVQLFIERVIRNLEPLVAPADVGSAQWEWMKRYRVWQANREVFLWPENWLYPELRDNPSPFFQQTMSSLLQGDITDDAAASAYLDYLTDLEAVAKLEPCGLYYQPGAADTDEASYVVARTAGAHRKYYFRELAAGSWTPWAQVHIECEDMPITPIVWNGRLFLFWLKAIKQVQPSQAQLSSTASDGSSNKLADMPVSDLSNFTTAAASDTRNNSVTVQAVLCWTEFYNGKWQPTKTSDVNHPTTIGSFNPAGPGSFEAYRNLVRIVPAQFTGTNPIAEQYGLTFALPSDSLMLAITVASQSPGPGGFILHNTHSLPVCFDDITFPVILSRVPLSALLDVPSPSRTFPPAQPYTGGYGSGTFAVSYQAAAGSATLYASNILEYTWLPRWIEPQPGLPEAWDAPFLYEDRRYLFYVTTTEQLVPVRAFNGFGILPASPGLLAPALRIAPLVLRHPVVALVPQEVLAVNAGGGDPAAVQRFLSGTTNINAALASPVTISYQGQVITPAGSLATLDPAAGGNGNGA